MSQSMLRKIRRLLGRIAKICSTPLQQPKSMSRKLQTRTPTIPKSNLFNKKSIIEHRKADIQLKSKQKLDSDKGHGIKEHPSFEKRRPIWIKTHLKPVRLL